MSNSENKIIPITYEQLQEMKSKRKSFLLCFTASNLKDNRGASVFHSCEYYCREYDLIKWYSIDFDTYLDRILSKSRCLHYRVLQYENGEEKNSLLGGFSPELHTFITTLKNKLKKQQSSLQQASSSKSSQKTGRTKRGSSDEGSGTVENQTRKRMRSSTSKTRIYEHTTTKEPTPPVSPHPSGSIPLPKCQVKSLEGLKMNLSICRPSESVPCPTKNQPSPSKCTAQHFGTRSFSSSGRSTPMMPKSPSHQAQSAEKVLQISPAGSVESLVSGKTPPISRTPASPFVEYQSEFSLSQSTPLDLTVHSRRTQSSASSLVRSPTQRQHVSFEQQSFSASHRLVQLSVIKYARRPTYTSVIQGPTRGILQQPSSQQIQRHHPSNIKHRSQRMMPPRHQQTESSRLPLSQSKISTVIRGPSRGAHHSHPHPPNK